MTLPGIDAAFLPAAESSGDAAVTQGAHECASHEAV